MTNYKYVCNINGKIKWFIEDEYGNINKNPTREELKLSIFGNKKREKRACCKDRDHKTYVRPNGKEEWYICSCKKENCTGYICKHCYSIQERYDQALWRHGELPPNTTVGKGFIGQQVVAKRYKTDDCNLKMNNFRFYVDLDKISGYGYCEVKIATLIAIDGRWPFGKINPETFDTLFLLCMDENWPWRRVERVYAIPWEVVGQRRYIAITKDSSREAWYEEFRIDKNPFNKIYCEMNLENCKVLRKE